MSKKVLTAKEKIEKAKLELKKAQDKIKKLEGQRKLEIVDILLKIVPDVSDYANNTLENAFKEVFTKLK